MTHLDRLNTGLGVMAVLFALYIGATLVFARIRDARNRARREALRRRWTEARKPQAGHLHQSAPSSGRSR
ncbi:MAG TPA: hypothetical protein VMU67_03915 [Steroidobacteraceae bacterium]|nr:hypothetical protein [Steroidobacteraceae bacterium]